MTSVLKPYELELDILSGHLVYVPIPPTILAGSGISLDYDSSTNKLTINSIGETMIDLTTLIDEDNQVTYIGYANPGTTSNMSSWKIKKITLINEDIKIEWAEGTSTFTKIWDQRKSYTYS